MSYNLKRFLILFVYTIFILFIFYMGERYIYVALREKMNETFDNSYMMFYHFLLPIIIGMLIALPKFIFEIKMQGKWRYHWVRLIAMGIPLVFITIMPTLYLLPEELSSILNVLDRPFDIIVFLPQAISGFILGYLILTFPYREKSPS